MEYRPVDERRYMMSDGRTLCVTRELDMWSVWLAGQEQSHVIGWPLEGVLTDAVGLNPAHDDPPTELLALAALIRNDFGSA
jgi:hypothetical protein